MCGKTCGCSGGCNVFCKTAACLKEVLLLNCSSRAVEGAIVELNAIVDRMGEELLGIVEKLLALLNRFLVSKRAEKEVISAFPQADCRVPGELPGAND